MNWTRRDFGGAVCAMVAMAAGGAALQAQETIRVGEINSYTALPAFTEPYRKGWQLALEQINEAGGIDGRMVEVIAKDDAGKPGDAVTAANELRSEGAGGRPAARAGPTAAPPARSP